MSTAVVPCIRKTARRRWRLHRSRRPSCSRTQHSRVYHKTRRSHCNKLIIVSSLKSSPPSHPFVEEKTRARVYSFTKISQTDLIDSQILPHLRTRGLDTRSVHSTIPVADWRIRILCLMVSTSCRSRASEEESGHGLIKLQE